MEKLDIQIPKRGDTVEVRNTSTGKTYSGEVRNVEQYDTERDVAVYVKFVHEEAPNANGDDGYIEYKEGYYDGEEYSWLRKAPVNTTNSTEVARDCWNFSVR